MFPHEAVNQSVSQNVSNIEINFMKPEIKIARGLQLLVGFYSLVLLVLICYSIFEYTPLSEHSGQIVPNSDSNGDVSQLDYDDARKWVFGICCFLPAIWHWYAFALILAGINELFFD